MLEFLKKHWARLLKWLVALLLLIGVYSLVKTGVNRSIIIGHPDNIIVISPDESQDVIVIGDPEKVNVKPKNKK